MWLFYIFALIPAFIGLILFLFNKKITWKEWIGGTIGGFIIAALMNLFAVLGMTSDIETWSDKVNKAVFYPTWIEEYKVAIYRTETYYTGSGKNRTMHTRRVFSHYETRHRTHNEYWNCETPLFNTNIEKTRFDDIAKCFGGIVTETPHKSGFDGGDPNIYVSYNKTGYIYPVTTLKHWANKIKAAPTVFSFPKIPTNISVYDWPENKNVFESQRLINEPRINLRIFDQMNAVVGPKKRCNVIMINFGNQDPSISKMQEAKYLGGKKNDLVLCYGQLDSNNIPAWSYVFSWSKKEMCKKNIQSILLTSPINDDIIPKIQREIESGFVKRDWSEFDYIGIEPPLWSYIVYFILMFVFQIGYGIWCNFNEFEKEI